jgi:hypothetical protein
VPDGFEFARPAVSPAAGGSWPENLLKTPTNKQAFLTLSQRIFRLHYVAGQLEFVSAFFRRSRSLERNTESFLRIAGILFSPTLDERKFKLRKSQNRLHV